MRTEKAFQLLELEVTASQQEIKDAYKAKVRQLHPDRVAVGANDTQWKEVNDRFSLIQKAYRTLTESNALGDHAYRIRKQRHQQEQRFKQASLQVFSIDDLPDQLIEELNKRRESDQQDQLFIPRDSMRNYMVILGISASFLAFLPFMLGWPFSMWDWVFVSIAGASVWGAAGYVGYKWLREKRATLAPGVWILPTDIIMVDDEQISVAPLMSLRRWSVNTNTGAVGNHDIRIRFRFYNSTMQLHLDSLNKVNQIEFAVRYWQKLWKRSENLMTYYHENSLVAELIFK
ncbi:MAG: J domain-containing protein [Bacteroidota bacterium]